MFSSEYKGVSFYKPTESFKATISINGKQKHLGYFTTEAEASASYTRAKRCILENRIDDIEFKRYKQSSKYKGVSFYSPNQKWKAQVCLNGRIQHIGYFKTEIEASEAYKVENKRLKD